MLGEGMRVKCTTFWRVLAHSRFFTQTQVMPSFIPVRTLAGRSSKKIISCLQQRRELACVSVAGARALGASIYLLFTFFFFDAYQEGNTTSSLNFSQVHSLSLSCANLWTAHTTRSRSLTLWTTNTTRSWCPRDCTISGGADTQRPRVLEQTSVRRLNAL